MAAVNAKARVLPSGVHRIEIAVPFLGSVNVWLLEGDPLTLVDTGPANTASLGALETALHAVGYSIAEIELVLLTHHHLDHSGLAGAIAAGSEARIAATAGRQHGARATTSVRALEASLRTPPPRRARRPPEGDRSERGLLRAHHPQQRELPDRPRPRAKETSFTPGAATIESSSARGTARPTRSSSTTSAALRSSATTCSRRSPREPSWCRSSSPGRMRRQALVQYLDGLRSTAAMELDLLLPGHGPEIHDHRLADRRANRVPRAAARAVAASIDAEGSTAFEIAQRVWDEETARDTGSPRDLGGRRASRRPHRARARHRSRRRLPAAACSDRACAEGTHRQSDSDSQRKEQRVIDRRHAKPPRAVRPHGLHRDRHRRNEGPRARHRDDPRRRRSGHRDREPQARGVRGDGGGGSPRRPPGASRSPATSRGGTSARPRRGRVRGVRTDRRACEQCRHRTDLPRPAGRDGGALGQDDRGQPQGPVPALRPRRSNG